MGARGPTEHRRRVPAEVVAALGRAAELGFVGPAELAGQIDHALGFVLAVEGDRLGGPATALDLGSGGGLPGLVLGACWPQCRIVLVEAGQRRAEFLKGEVATLPQLDRVEVLRGRAEELARESALRQQFDVVISRSFGPPAVTAECGSPFALPGGLMVVSEPPGGNGDERWPGDGLAELELVDGGVLRIDDRFGYRLLRKVGSTADRFPRRTGVPGKRPLF